MAQKYRIALSVLALALLLAQLPSSFLGVWRAHAATESVESEASAQDTSHSVFPIAGYNPTYGVFLGGGYFYESSPVDFGLHGVVTFERVYKFIGKTEYRFAPQWSVSLDSEYSQGFDPFYGVGSHTRVGDQLKVFGARILSEARVTRKFWGDYSAGLLTEYRYWKKDAQNRGPEYQAVPDDSTWVGGVFAGIDMMKGKRLAEKGFSQEFRLKGNDRFGLAETDFRVLYPIVPEYLQVGFRFLAGAGVGDPSYTFNYRLGGTDLLRGYHENRFRGHQMHLEQFELRFPIYKILSGVAYTDVGEATQSGFGAPRISAGGGLRLAIPPDYVETVRLDVGWGQDQWGAYFDFGQAF